MNIVIFLAAFLGLIICALGLYQLSVIATAARDTQENTAKAVVLLTVLANKQGASEDDIKKATAKA